MCSMVNCLDIRLIQLEGREKMKKKMGEDENNEKRRIEVEKDI